MTEIINKYKKHIPIIFALVLLEFFVTDIFSAIYLPMIKTKLKSNTEGKLYEKGQYTPMSAEGPKDYDFVFVSSSKNTTEETYYTKKSEKTVVTYINGKWQQSTSSSAAFTYFIAFPFAGFILFMASILHKMARTGALTTWGLGEHPDDKFEQMTKLYGIPLFVCFILFGWIGRY